MFGVVKDKDISRGGLSGDDEWTLRHVSGPVQQQHKGTGKHND